MFFCSFLLISKNAKYKAIIKVNLGESFIIKVCLLWEVLKVVHYTYMHMYIFTVWVAMRVLHSDILEKVFF